MRFEVSEDTRFERPLVFAVHRDEIEKIAAFLPDVERVEVRGRSRRADGTEEQVQWWHGTGSSLPVFVRPMIPAHLLVWRQVTVWDAAAFVARWKIDLPGLGDAVTAEGTNTYRETAKGCRIDVEGDFAFRPERVPQLAAIPPAAVPIVEKVVVGIVVPMIQRSGEAVGKYLESR